MPFRKLLALAALILFCTLAPAKDKKKAVLPADVPHAQTALVIIDPAAGVDAADPNANRIARQAVEEALNRWGRFRLVQDGYTADLVIMVRKGNGKVAQTTIGGTPINGIPPVGVGSTSSPTQTTTRAGGRWGDPGPQRPLQRRNPAFHSPTAGRSWFFAGYLRCLSRKHGSELVSHRGPGGLAVFREGCARIAFGSSGRGLPQAGRGVGEATGLPTVAGFPLIIFVSCLPSRLMRYSTRHFARSNVSPLNSGAGPVK